MAHPFDLPEVSLVMHGGGRSGRPSEFHVHVQARQLASPRLHQQRTAPRSPLPPPHLPPGTVWDGFRVANSTRGSIDAEGGGSEHLADDTAAYALSASGAPLWGAPRLSLGLGSAVMSFISPRPHRATAPGGAGGSSLDPLAGLPSPPDGALSSWQLGIGGGSGANDLFPPSEGTLPDSSAAAESRTKLAQPLPKVVVTPEVAAAVAAAVLRLQNRATTDLRPATSRSGQCLPLVLSRGFDQGLSYMGKQWGRLLIILHPPPSPPTHINPPPPHTSYCFQSARSTTGAGAATSMVMDRCCRARTSGGSPCSWLTVPSGKLPLRGTKSICKTQS